MQLDPNRQDKPIIQSIALIDSLDKNINLFAMRVREWYCWHFPGAFFFFPALKIASRTRAPKWGLPICCDLYLLRISFLARRKPYVYVPAELGKIITDNIKFAETARLIGVRDSFDPNDEEKFQVNQRRGCFLSSAEMT